MKITDLADAEKIVQNNAHLGWDGWQIIYKVQDDDAQYDIRGSYDRGTGKWYKRISYPYINGTGWDIPNTLIKG